MSDEKHAQLIAEGKLWPDGTRKITCPTCGTEMAQGQELIGMAEGSAVAEAETVEVGTAPGEV